MFAGTIVDGVGTPSDGDIVKVPPLQIVAVWFGITGVGFTVTVTVNDDPMQVPAAPEVGVIEYVAVCTVAVGLMSVPLMFAALLPAVPPVMPPVTVGKPQV